jgi:transcriptional regulator with XRE-family HTH domain
MSLARRIRDCRYAKGWGPDELANRARISRTALYQIECGKTETPRAGTLNRIARALGVTVEALMAGSMVAWDGAAARDLPGLETSSDDLLDLGPAVGSRIGRLAPLPPTRELELEHKFRELLHSPLREGVVRLVEATYRLLPAATERTAV